MNQPFPIRLRIILVMLLIAAVINVGCYVWINNAVAVMPRNDPTTLVLLELYDDFYDQGHRDLTDDILTSPEDLSKSAAARNIIHGNGDRDDNRGKSYFYCWVSSPTMLPKAIKSSTTFNERYTAATYKDFGHLKVMPAANKKRDYCIVNYLPRGKISHVTEAFPFFIFKSDC